MYGLQIIIMCKYLSYKGITSEKIIRSLLKINKTVKNLLFVIAAAMLMNACEKKETMVLISTDMGDITVKLYDETPKHKANFLKNVEEGNIEGALFHRVIKNFMMQGGDPTSIGVAADARLGSGSLPDVPLVDAEFDVNLIHKKGALAAARTGGPSNPEKKSSNCQFYIVQGKAVTDAELNQLEKQKNMTYGAEQRAAYKEVGGTPFLDQDYTVFGEVVDGLDVIDKICAVQIAPGDRPVEDVKMSLKVVK